MSRDRRLSVFFRQHPVFRRGEFAKFLTERGTCNITTHNSLLTYHLSHGHIVRLRQGVYGSIPPSTPPAAWQPDPYLVASRLSPDAVIAYHAALALRGKAYSLSNDVAYLTGHGKQIPFLHQGIHYRSVTHPEPLQRLDRTDWGVVTVPHAGAAVRVTSYERTLVDMLDRPRLAGGWEETWRSLEAVEHFDLDAVVEYALLLGNATTVARVGLYLDQHRDALTVEERHREMLRRHRPQRPHYWERGRRSGGRLVKDWNLIVPEEVLERRWEKPA